MTIRSPTWAGVSPSPKAIRKALKANPHVELQDRATKRDYTAREVQLGSRIGNAYPIVSGLKEGERVVYQGAFTLDAELQIRGGASMMTLPDDVTRGATRVFDVPPKVIQRLSPLVMAYLDLSAALSKDDLAAAKTAFKASLFEANKIQIQTPTDAAKRWKELHAQALSYLALAGSDDPVLLQSALAERLARQLTTLAGQDQDALRERVEAAGLRTELADQIVGLRVPPDALAATVSDAMKRLYDLRMRATGQNGISDYDRGFTDFLYALETGKGAHRAATGPGRVWGQGGVVA